MGQRSSSNCAAEKDVQTLLSKEECAVGMGYTAKRTMNLLHLDQSSDKQLQLNPNSNSINMLRSFHHGTRWRKHSRRGVHPLSRNIRSLVLLPTKPRQSKATRRCRFGCPVPTGAHCGKLSYIIIICLGRVKLQLERRCKSAFCVS